MFLPLVRCYLVLGPSMDFLFLSSFLSLSFCSSFVMTKTYFCSFKIVNHNVIKKIFSFIILTKSNKYRFYVNLNSFESHILFFKNLFLPTSFPPDPRQPSPCVFPHRSKTVTWFPYPILSLSSWILGSEFIFHPHHFCTVWVLGTHCLSFPTEEHSLGYYQD